MATEDEAFDIDRIFERDARGQVHPALAPPSLKALLEYFSAKEGRFLVSQVRPSSFSRRRGDRPSFAVDLAALQRLQLRRLQCKLASHARHLQDGREPPEDNWEDDLHRYVEALQDHEYMEKWHGRSRDPFQITGARAADRELLEGAMAGLRRKGTGHPSYVWWERDYLPVVGVRPRNRARAFAGRVVVAAVGAAFLIGPMWLMMLNNRLYVALISTTAFIVVFGLLMAYVLNENGDVLSSTAAYAAVLVVFVALTVPSTN